MASGFTSPILPLGLSKGPNLGGFHSPLFLLGLGSYSVATTNPGATSYWGFWMGGFSGGATANSPWYFLNSSRIRRED